MGSDLEEATTGLAMTKVRVQHPELGLECCRVQQKLESGQK